MTVKQHHPNNQNSPSYTLSGLNFNCDAQSVGGKIWFSDPKVIPPDGEFELTSQDQFVHLLIRIFSQSTAGDEHREFKVLGKLS
jgi:hypothetical protein